MLTQEQFYNLVSGRVGGFSANLLRTGLQILEIPYSLAVTVRNTLYHHQILPIYRSSLPIISVGNLTLGGTGKSPMVAWLCRFYLEQKRHPGLISRGYGKIPNAGNTGNNAGNDEFLEMSLRFPNVRHIQHRKRAEAVQILLQTENADLIIMDDAFQHRQVARNIDLVLLDATAPFGFDHLLPRGTLRESPKGLRRADIVLLTRSDLISESERQNIRRRVLSINPHAIWGETIHVPTSLIALKSFCEEPIASLAGKSALAFCGIGNPAAFQATLEKCGVHVEKLVIFPDHYHYTCGDVEALKRTAEEIGTDEILCTMKDLVKLNRPEFPELPFRAVSIAIEFLSGESEVRHRLGKIGM